VSILKAENEKKWVTTFIAFAAMLIAFIWISFIYQMGEWFDLESRVKFFTSLVQISGAAIGFVSFFVTVKNETVMTFLKQVYAELLKAVWPDRETVIKLSIGIMIAVTIISGILLMIDWGSELLLRLIY